MVSTQEAENRGLYIVSREATLRARVEVFEGREKCSLYFAQGNNGNGG
jgi:hypothetical protein